MLTWTGRINSNAGTTTSANLARMFTPRTPMYEPGVELQQLRVWMDIPEELATALRDGMEKIAPECLRRNAEIVLDIFQEIIVKHVLSMQIQNRTYGRIIRGNPSTETESSDPPSAIRLTGVVAKSSLLGRDPWGDKALPVKPAGEDEETAEGAETAPVYTEIQALLKSVQDTTWHYLTTHVKRILQEEILMSVIDLEMEYKADKDGMRNKMPRKRMPWKAYRDLTLEATTDSSGLYELQVLLALCREIGETVGRWLQRLRIGKTLVEKANIQLPESLYVNLAIRFFTRTEIKAMATSLAQGASRGSQSMSQARRAIRKLKWDKLRVLVESSVHTGGQKYTTNMHKHLGETRLFTLEQAKNYLKAYKTPRAGIPGAPKSRGQERKYQVRCRKCMRAGLVGKVTHHATEDCVDRVRKQNVEKLAKLNPKKRSRERLANPSSSKEVVKQARKTVPRKATVEEECRDCKSSGRPFRHSPKDCKYAPGGPWHKKSGEELRALQRKYYDGKGRTKTGRSQSHAAVQERKVRKRTRGEEDQAKSLKDPKRPLWDREYTMIAEQQTGSKSDPENMDNPQNFENQSSCSIYNQSLTPGVKCSSTATETVTVKNVCHTRRVALLVKPPAIVDFSPLTSKCGPFTAESDFANLQKEAANDSKVDNLPDGSMGNIEESANQPKKPIENSQPTACKACSLCDLADPGTEADEEYECCLLYTSPSPRD